VQVAKHFTEVFHELVPQGSASLVMQTSDVRPLSTRRSVGLTCPQETQDDEDDTAAAAAAAPRGRVRRYVGVGIRVSFTGAGESVAMNLLSGGQKSVVALALIFAIQRCGGARWGGPG
jgi:structural maintenance of chromosome 3 (chondroitin sulfate proteoglycan 6)